MLARFTLRTRILVLLAALIAANVLGAAVTIAYISQTRSLYTSLVDRDINALKAAQALETALVMQKGHATYYFLDSNPEWLNRLEHYHHAFEHGLVRARESAYLSQAISILNTLESAYLRYIHNRQQVIDLYASGQRDAGAARHWAVRGEFQELINLCEQYKALHEQNILRTQKNYGKNVRRVTLLASVALPFTLSMGLLLGFILLKQVLIPLRQLAQPEKTDGRPPAGNEVQAVGQRMRTLRDEVDQSYRKLAKSREHLLMSEKLALVGKLSASVAHSIRNPLTSVKMRLFSLERGIVLTPAQKEDFAVISEEIRHLDTIIANFLEFARPPRLSMQRVSISDIVDNTLELLRHRLESYNTRITVSRRYRMPRINADPEQMKEVLVNLVINACDAMGEGGSIKIAEEKVEDAVIGSAVSLTVEDSGPGVPPDLAEKIFEPFFSSKEEGTGLGLSIARRIVSEHGGVISLEAAPGKGATFCIVLPCREETAWEES
jgi:signal transduction histidine kinase